MSCAESVAPNQKPGALQARPTRVRSRLDMGLGFWPGRGWFGGTTPSWPASYTRCERRRGWKRKSEWGWSGGCSRAQTAMMTMTMGMVAGESGREAQRHWRNDSKGIRTEASGTGIRFGLMWPGTGGKPAASRRL